MHRLSTSRALITILALSSVLWARASRASDDVPASDPAPPGPATPVEETPPASPPQPVEPVPAEPSAPSPEPPPVDAAPKPPADAAFPADPSSRQPEPGSRSRASHEAKRAQVTSSEQFASPNTPPPGPRATRTAMTSLPPDPEPQKRDSSDGLFGPIRIGFLIGVGLPNLLNFGGTAKITRFLGGGINVGIIPTARLSYYGEATLSYQEYDIYGRIYPFGGGFFLGAGVGYEQVRGTLRGNVDLAKQMIPQGLLPPGYQLPTSVDYDARGSVRTMVLTPQLGYLHTFGSGFSIGIDVGAQIPIAPSAIKFESTASPPELAELQPFKDQQAKVRDTLKTVGQTPLPTLNFRIGWLL